MPSFMHEPAFLGLSPLQVLILLGLVGLVSTVIQKTKAGGSGYKPPQNRVKIKCFGCGWEGLTSKHTLRCPKCGGTGLTPDQL